MSERFRTSVDIEGEDIEGVVVMVGDGVMGIVVGVGDGVDGTRDQHPGSMSCTGLPWKDEQY